MYQCHLPHWIIAFYCNGAHTHSLSVIIWFSCQSKIHQFRSASEQNAYISSQSSKFLFVWPACVLISFFLRQMYVSQWKHLRRECQAVSTYHWQLKEFDILSRHCETNEKPFGSNMYDVMSFEFVFSLFFYFNSAKYDPYGWCYSIFKTNSFQIHWIMHLKFQGSCWQIISKIFLT